MLDKNTREKYTVVIGLEVHAQLLTKSKIFSSDANQYGASPNTNISAITLGHPGTLPLLNKQVIEFAIRMGLACGSEITRYNIFDRKNYFYPDLPKGYQIMQDKTPICVGGGIYIRDEEEEKQIKLHHIHLEEDAGKSIHLDNEPETLVDLNRAGVPLIEIVTDPDLRSSDEAYAMLTEIRKLVRYLDICDGNMEEGSMRCDANVSIMPKGASEYGKKVEVKNMNSIRNVQRAIDHEVERQILLLEAGEEVISETRLFNADNGKTFSMRTKEELNDYRYFPEPDLSPVVVSEAWLEEIKESMPALPHELWHKFVDTYELPPYNAEVLTDTKAMARYFEEVCCHTRHYKGASNWMMGPVRSYLNDASHSIEKMPVKAESLAELVEIVAADKVSFAIASQKIFPYMLEDSSGKSPLKIAEEMNLLHESSSDQIQPLVEEVLADFPQKVEQYRKGKKGLLGMFMGEVMKRSQGKANPKVANALLRKELD
ncbi:aspartyl-tRNA(Asn)/glutamyl-tRNA(Gln) amidotransferase subunit B [Catalinimonas alkaloidigena]|uniref:Asp-tRNA(Asn)/Glu-tRNA(Gln) amidotransferase subunit GatB n=1 Tax=Catalinimonas alkaloidigena TaxID=1075417 RepID=UPI002406B7E1|nr:Asp-tRNA(Asn)/Glu-tRNA(Gln) amidotransferase subunit GatB [Catalinimonas alkaloidigena]MDF9799734.1 aspartyl-tRNA(Asn)/glutamyl-tRNA(Gln) amidotransferase subunit B [Catalinimonas alkaloidigena]